MFIPVRTEQSATATVVLDLDGPMCGAGDEPEEGGAPLQIGRFTVLHELGAGGMGVVYAAYDAELDRSVALKLMHVGRHGSGGRARLLREAQAMARLSHPNVVQVYDVGEYRRQIFLALELVRGQTLREWMPTQPRPWREVRAVYLQAGEGLIAAHAAGLVHRDFKPDNVLIGEEGRVRVVDFGLARLDELGHSGAESATSSDRSSPMLTRADTLLGTPAYMAPEQMLRQPADARSDQFSFCVSLWEALYGERPFIGANVDELLNHVLRGPPEAPRHTLVPGWLQRVLRRGLSVSPAARHPSMQALLTDLQRDLKAHRGLRLAGVAALGLAAAVGGFAAAVMRSGEDTCVDVATRWAEVWDPPRKLEIQRALFDTGASYAAETWTQVQAELDAYAGAWTAMHTQACLAHRRGEQSALTLDLRMLCLEDRRRELKALTDVLAVADLQVTGRAARAASDLRPLARCADVAALAAERARMPGPEDPETEVKVEGLRGRLLEAAALGGAGRYAAALVQAEAIARESADLGHAPLLAEALLMHGHMLERTGDYGRAEQVLRAAHDAAERASHEEVRLDALLWLVRVVGLHLERFEEAEVWASVARPAIDRFDPGGARAARLLASLGNVRWRQGKYAAAQALQEQALALDEALFGPNHVRVAATLANLGSALTHQGAHKAALARFERALAIERGFYGPNHPEVASTLANIGIVLYHQGDYVQAQAYGERALAIEERVLGPEHPELAATLTNLALALGDQGKFAAAEASYRRALAIQERGLGLDHPEVANTLNSLGVLLLEHGDLDDAQRRLQRAVEIGEHAPGKDDATVAMALDNLGRVARARRSLPEARDYFTRALALLDAALGPDDPMTGSPALNLGMTLIELGEAKLALPPLERVLKLEIRDGGDLEVQASARFTLARQLWPADPSRAAELAGEADALYRGDANHRYATALAEVEAWRAGHVAP